MKSLQSQCWIYFYFRSLTAAFLASSLTLISSIAIAAATVVIDLFDNGHDPGVDYTTYCIVNTDWTAFTLQSTADVHQQFTLATRSAAAKSTTRAGSCVWQQVELVGWHCWYLCSECRRPNRSLMMFSCSLVYSVRSVNCRVQASFINRWRRHMRIVGALVLRCSEVHCSQTQKSCWWWL